MDRNIFFFVLIFYFCFQIYGQEFKSALNDIQAKANEKEQTDAVRKLFYRLLRNESKFLIPNVDFNMKTTELHDTFKILKNESSESVYITGSSGVAVAWGLHYYLKYYCNCHISWEYQQLELPSKLPTINVSITANDRFRYYQNVCTTSYSFVWWNWPQWERHIDWMALNGFNLPLAFTGQEAIWNRVYLQLGLTQTEIDVFFPGPAFLSWFRMGNMRGFGGPLSPHWHNFTISLQHKILDRMRSFGMFPVLPAFAGFVPRALKQIFPNATFTQMERWNSFIDNYCCPYFLDTNDPLFSRIGQMFLNEGPLEGFQSVELKHAAFYIFYQIIIVCSFQVNIEVALCQFKNYHLIKALTEIFSIEKSILALIIQNWFLVNDFLFWTDDKAQALLTSVPIGRMIVLDLQSEQHPQYERLHSYFGHYFIWCMLHDFGGTLGMFGSLNILNKEVIQARQMPNSTMIGTGLTPEGINQNYIVYDFMSEMGWRKDSVNLTKWVSDYATRRYGKFDTNANKAWQLLKNGVYNYSLPNKIRGKYVICRRPRLHLNPWFWYETCDLLAAWDRLIAASESLNSSLEYQYDIVDTTRQVLQVLGDLYYPDILKALKQKDLYTLQATYNTYMEIFDDMNEILASQEQFLLGRWLNSAKALADSEIERKQFEYNARNQITLWGPNGEIVDYANKQWAGVVSHYFKPRWALFFHALNESLVTGKAFNESAISKRILDEVEIPFTLDRSEFSDIPQGDSIKIAQRIHKRWWSEEVRKRCVPLQNTTKTPPQIQTKEFIERLRKTTPIVTNNLS